MVWYKEQNEVNRYPEIQKRLKAHVIKEKGELDSTGEGGPENSWGRWGERKKEGSCAGGGGCWG